MLRKVGGTGGGVEGVQVLNCRSVEELSAVWEGMFAPNSSGVGECRQVYGAF